MAIGNNTDLGPSEEVMPAPVLWSFHSGAIASGIVVGERGCWVGTESGDVFTLTPEGVVTGRFRLPDAVKCLVADGFWIYAACDDNRVYDLSGTVPRVAYEIPAEIDICSLDIHEGLLCVTDRKGGITAIEWDGELLWSNPGDEGGVIQIDSHAVYHGHSAGVTGYDVEGGYRVCHEDTDGAVLSGCQDSNAIYAGTDDNCVEVVGKNEWAGISYLCDAPVQSCATSPDGRVFAGDDCSSVYCWDISRCGAWKWATGCGSASSMQYHDDKLYLVTTTGTLACLDVSEAAIRDAEQSVLPETVSVTAPEISAVVPSSTVEVTSDAGTGIVVECVLQNGEQCVIAVSPDHVLSLDVQFPKDLWRSGARYVVDDVDEPERGFFYRLRGDIRQLI
ncbi:PQQ-binding-like beta-propeller repeat protein [Nocardia sp. NPDC051787]|uniref:PQQ-binding-like beta-propeller repeat protein n=1 Tax=Nocardia sp. NPDC051787 TaxID=3155415 RepID=UPI0034353782